MPSVEQVLPRGLEARFLVPALTAPAPSVVKQVFEILLSAPGSVPRFLR
jgi:hypothetical protein